MPILRPAVLAGWLVALLACCPNAWGQIPSAMRYQFNKGDEIPWTVQQSQIIKAAMGELVTFATVVTHADVVWYVNDVDNDGVAQIACKLRRISMRSGDSEDLRAANTTMLDSTDKDFKGNDLSKLYLPLIKDGLTYRMNPRGIITDMKPPEELQKALKEQGELPGFEARVMVMEFFCSLCHPTELIFPADGIDKGKSWKGSQREFRIGNLVNLSQQLEFTREGIEARSGREIDRISVKPCIKFGVAANEQAKEFFKIMVQDSKSVVYFDKKAGQITGANLTLDYIMEVAEANVEIRIRQFTTLKRTEKAK